jgi:hypothetical protein
VVHDRQDRARDHQETMSLTRAGALPIAGVDRW